MTVTYLQHVQTSKIGGFLRLLLIWKGSVLKGIWKNLAIFLALWYFILIVYRFALVKNEDMKQTFERMCVFFDAHDTSIPLGFILGFYVSQIGEWIISTQKFIYAYLLLLAQFITIPFESHVICYTHFRYAYIYFLINLFCPSSAVVGDV